MMLAALGLRSGKGPVTWSERLLLLHCSLKGTGTMRIREDEKTKDETKVEEGEFLKPDTKFSLN